MSTTGSASEILDTSSTVGILGTNNQQENGQLRLPYHYELRPNRSVCPITKKNLNFSVVLSLCVLGILIGITYLMAQKFGDVQEVVHYNDLPELRSYDRKPDDPRALPRREAIAQPLRSSGNGNTDTTTTTPIQHPNVTGSEQGQAVSSPPSPSGGVGSRTPRPWKNKFNTDNPTSVIYELRFDPAPIFNQATCPLTPNHRSLFKVTLTVAGSDYLGYATKKKDAKKMAAEQAILDLYGHSYNTVQPDLQALQAQCGL